MEISDAQLVLEMVKEKMAKAVEYLITNWLPIGRQSKSCYFLRCYGRVLRYTHAIGPGVQYFCSGCPDYDYSALGENTHSSHRKSHYGCQSGLHPSEQRGSHSYFSTAAYGRTP